MWQKKCLLVCFLSYITLEAKAVDVASIISPCKVDDDACLQLSTQNAVEPVAAGLPELGVPPSDPVHIDSMKCDKNDLQFTFENNHVTGPNKAKIIEVARDADKKTIKLVIETPFFLKGQYKSSGKILFVPVVGDGDFELKTDNIRFTVLLKTTIKERDGKNYWKINGFDFNFELKEKFALKFDNLFNGDETLAKPVNDLLDSNWREVVLEFGDCIMEKVVTKYVENVNKLFHAVPTDQLEIA